MAGFCSEKLKNKCFLLQTTDKKQISLKMSFTEAL